MDRIIEKKKWTKKKLILIGCACLFLFFLIYLFFFRDMRSSLNVDKTKLSIAKVEKNKFQEYIYVDGTVQPLRTVFIDAVQGGTVEEIFVEDGAILKKGDVILKLANPSVELDYMNRETQMYDIINNLQNTKLNIEQSKFAKEKEVVDLNYKIDKSKKEFETNSQLYKEKVISTKEYEYIKRDFEMLIKQRDIVLRSQKHDSIYNLIQISQIKSSIERLGKNLILLKENLGNLYIKAPIDGQLSSFNAEIGETKNIGQNLGQIDALEGFKIKASIDEHYLGKVFVGQEADVDYNNKTFTLKVKKIYTKISSGKFDIDLVFSEAPPIDIKKGQSLQVRLKFSGVSDAIIIPKGGYYQETNGNWIYVLDASGKYAIKRTIRTGRQNSEYYEILEGLSVGEEVISSSYDSFGGKDKLKFE